MTAAPANFVWFDVDFGLQELYCTVDTGAKFSICLPTSEGTAFSHAILTNHACVVDAFSKISVRHSEAGSEDDRRMIFKAVQGVEGGFDGIDSMVLACVRKWCVHTAQRLLEERRIDGESKRQSSNLKERPTGRPLLDYAVSSSYFLPEIARSTSCCRCLGR